MNVKRERSHPLQKGEKEDLATHRLLWLTSVSGKIMDIMPLQSRL